MLKQELRAIYKTKRKELINREELSAQIAQQFFDFFAWESYQNFHIFLPMIKMQEVNTQFIYQKLWQAHKNVFSPVVKENSMISVPFYDLEQCQTSDWGIPEPMGKSQNPKLDVVFMPLLYADEKGNRLGYGKGFYDEFLAKLSPETLKIGLNFFLPNNEIIEDIRPQDVALDYLVTPSKVLSFGDKSMK